MKQETLLPGTDALPRATVEWTVRKGKQLIRYRRPDGTTWQRSFPKVDEASAFFDECTNDLREQARSATEAQRGIR